MSHIVAATDFSDIAANAIHYACGLAGEKRMPVTIIHTFMIPVSFGETPMPLIPVEDGLNIAETQMKKLLAEVSGVYPDLQLASKIMYGDIVDCLEEYVGEANPWLVVVGNSHMEGEDAWVGSSVASILRHVKATTIAVPNDAVYSKPGNICFACDLKNVSDDFRSDTLVALVNVAAAQLHVLTIGSKKGSLEPSAQLEASSLHTALAPLNPVYHHVESEETDDAIIDFVNSNHMDWLVIAPHKHAFLEGLFHKSHTKAVAKKINVPVVAIHEGGA